MIKIKLGKTIQNTRKTREIVKSYLSYNSVTANAN